MIKQAVALEVGHEPWIPKNTSPVLALGIALGLSACASVDHVDSTAYFDAATSAAPIEPSLNARGVTQKVRITDQLAYVVQQDLGSPEGSKAMLPKTPV